MEADRSQFDVGSLLAETRALITRSSWRVLVAGIVMTAVGVLLDLSSDGRSTNILFSFAALIFQWRITTFLLAEFGKGASEGSGSIIGVSFLSGFGIVLGLILLVIPGIILFVRWSIAVPIVLSERQGASAALRESWYRTEGHFWPIFGLFLLIYVPVLIVGFGVGALLPATMALATSIAINAAATLALIVGWHAAIALFFASDPPAQALEEVFA